jgi:hypothetical protein
MPIASLKAILNPLDGTHWKVEPISIDEIVSAVAESNTCDKSWQELQEAGLPAELHRTFHVMRIAYLYTADRVERTEHPTFLCVSTNESWFFDGNHRAAAAIARGDESITLKIANSGELDLFRLFPGLAELDGAQV